MRPLLQPATLLPAHSPWTVACSPADERESGRAEPRPEPHAARLPGSGRALHVRRVSCSLLGLLTMALVVGLCLPRRSEVRRTATFHASPRVVHEFLAALPRGPAWCSWEPAQRPAGPGSLRPTASIEFRGVWFDVPSARGLRKAALLLEPVREGTRVEWLDVLHLRALDPWASLGSLTRERRIGAQMEASLEALSRWIAD